jgi:hypothetical protein
MERVTRTTNKLHFEDLDPLRFENLVLDLLCSWRRWKRINSVGQASSDSGVDIIGREGDGTQEIEWHVQCKRHKRLSISEIDKALSKLEKNFARHESLILATACNVSKRMVDHVVKRATSIGYATVLVWDRSFLETMLFQGNNRILRKYFGVDESGDPEEDRIRSKIKLKSFLREKLIAPFDPSKPLIGTHRFNYSDIILRALNEKDGSFTQDEFGYRNQFGWYSQKRAEPFHMHEDGLSLVTGIRQIYYNDHSWSLTWKEGLSSQTKAMEIGELDYENIVQIDLDTDDCRPVIYCNFEGRLGPFSALRYKPFDLELSSGPTPSFNTLQFME